MPALPRRPVAPAVGRGYGEQAIEGEETRVRTAPQGVRNDTLNGSPDDHVGHATAFVAGRSWGSLSSIGPAASMTRARAASAE